MIITLPVFQMKSDHKTWQYIWQRTAPFLCFIPLYLNYAVSHPFWWHPAPLAQFPERVTSSSAITVPLIWLRPTSSRLHRPLRLPGLLASKLCHYLTARRLMLLSEAFAESWCLYAPWLRILCVWHKTWSAYIAARDTNRPSTLLFIYLFIFLPQPLE